MKKLARILGWSALAATIASGIGGCSKQASESPVPATEIAAPSSTTNTQAPDLTLTQEVDGPYVPGATLTVKTIINYTGAEPVTALALRTTLPQAWRYGGTKGELKPAIDPPKGATGQATLIWIQIPSFPAMIEYTLEVPEWTEGTHKLTTQAIYRTLGGEIQSPIHEIAVTQKK